MVPYEPAPSQSFLLNYGLAGAPYAYLPAGNQEKIRVVRERALVAHTGYFPCWWVWVPSRYGTGTWYSCTSWTQAVEIAFPSRRRLT
jgi:hypothetical protein